MMKKMMALMMDSADGGDDGVGDGGGDTYVCVFLSQRRHSLLDHCDKK